MTLLDKGFRPFFLGAAILAAVVVPLWVLVWHGVWAISGPLQGPLWHAHEMVFGFAGAVLSGFLLTAVSNWTGRETARGPLLGALVLVWLAGRIVLLLPSGWFGSVVDLAFLPLLAVVVGRPLWLARNPRNAPFPVLILALAATNLVVHLDAHAVWVAAGLPALRMAVHWLVVIILVVAGRIVPMFTRNATGAPDIRSHRRVDRAAIGLAVVATALVPFTVPAAARAGLLGLAAVLVFARAWHWGAVHTLRNPLLWVLHVGHAAVGVGLGAEALGALGVVAPSLALHVLTVGAIGTLTLGMMARVALGHTGRPLVAPTPVAVGFGLVVVATTVRVLGPIFAPAATVASVDTAGLLWCIAFSSYAIVYGPILLGPRVDEAS